MEELFGRQVQKQLSKASPTPLYHQLYTVLKTMVIDGTLELGARMPTEEQLAELFSVSRITAKRAMDELANENLVQRRRGKGTHVIYRYSPKPVYAPLTGMLQEIESMARNSSAEILDYGMRVPPQSVRNELELADGQTALHLLRVRVRDNLKFGYYTSWTAGVEMPTNPATFENTPRLAYFRANGLEVTHVTQTLSAIAADAAVARALEVTEGSPLLSLTRRSFKTENGIERLMDFLQVLYNPEHFQYSMDLTLT